ncbi:hypothetical protein STCU_06455 [Strigomonas culicis]|uniref:Uncharacterized protein n=2 Tax=Strigomonas culicis TaxID=28005 RepID=S9VFJ3_9TRYP|nr:hypothetical protein STCU_09184 [Strigomonas culicis]EPY25831.1 hypothetical protein STCU_06455 [Strigomonas culicis]|eukprot:EPY20040.1 hypothetical protein STCU_09184 [Strigomonas culicis]
MRRFVSRSCLATAIFHQNRFSAETPLSPEAIRDILQKAENDRLDKEAKVDSRNVVFTSAASADHRPRVAAAEAFDVAAAALPRPPNFCYMNVSLDYSAMIDAPEVVWFNMCRANDVTPSTVKPQLLHMIGGTVCQQKLGGGFIQVVLGCIPDLETESFTFDAIPDAKDIHKEGHPPPAVCFASLDTKLSLQYERVLSSHLNQLAANLGKACPLVGGLYPSVNNPNSETKPTEQLEDSIFFINARVFKGSAAAIIMRSKMLQARATSIVPSIGVGSATVDEMTCEDGIYTILKLNGRTATDVIKDVYMSEDLRDKPCKVFLGVHYKDVSVPVSFIGNPKSGIIQFTLPGEMVVRPGDTIDFLVDDAELDTEAAASLLLGLEKEAKPISIEKDITIAREARKNIVASSAAAFHFSHVGLNSIARPEAAIINLGNSNVLFAPSILQRCLGKSFPNSGFFSPGQVATVSDITAIFPRSSTYCILEGLS